MSNRKSAKPVPYGVVATLLLSALSAMADQSEFCPEEARCVAARATGHPDAHGRFLAQCTGMYPDFVDEVPSTYEGTRFVLSQAWPQEIPVLPSPWENFSFRKRDEVREYLLALRSNIYDAMLPVGWRAGDASPRWYHVPWMNVGAHPREFINGMTEERSVTGPELGLKPGAKIQNWAVGFYNGRGGFALGQFWRSGAPDTRFSQMPDGTVVAKVLASDAVAGDFANEDILAGAPTMSANIKRRSDGLKEITSLRVLQIDVAVRDAKAGASGWVFGTFAYDRDSSEIDPWRKMEPVGTMWGNDPTLGPEEYAAGTRPTEGVVLETAPQYARNHLGWQDRVNGPVDNPVSSCLSCHSTAQTGANSPMTWNSTRITAKCTDAQKLQWFRNTRSDEPFGVTNPTTCVVTSGGSGTDGKPVVALDYSLQQAVAFQNATNPDNFNPCVEPLTPSSSAAPKDSERNVLNSMRALDSIDSSPVRVTNQSRYTFER